MRSYNFCHTNTKNPGNNLGFFCLITGRPKLNGYEWNHIIDACGGTKYAAEVSSGERWESGLLLQKMSDCGGTPFNLWYWASDGNASLGTNGIGWNINFNNIAWWYSAGYGYVRDCFTF
jgi:hypothetical protein